MHGARFGSSTKPPGVKRKRSPGIYKRVKGSQFLSSAGVPQIQGPWSVKKLISLIDVLPSAENISRL